MADPNKIRDFSNFQDVMQGFTPDAGVDPFVAAAQAQQGFNGLSTDQAANDMRRAELAAMMRPAAPAPVPAPSGFNGLDTDQNAIRQRMAELQALMQVPQGSVGMPSEAEQSRGGGMQMPMESITARPPNPNMMQMPAMNVGPRGPQAPAEIEQLFAGFQPEAQLQQLAGLGVGRMQPPVNDPATAGMNPGQSYLAQPGLQSVGMGAGTADASASSTGNPYQYGSPDWIAFEQYSAGGR